MRTAVLRVGGAPPLRVWVADSEAEQEVGLQGLTPLGDGEGMLFPGESRHIAMMGVSFPIDILFFTGGRLSYVVTAVPGDQRVWSYPGSTAVLETRAGWARDYGLRVGDPLLASL